MKPVKKFGGFSLLETVVAVAVLLMAISGPLSLAFFSLKSASLVENNTIAAYLAQEGMEFIKAYRATNVLKVGRNNWLNDMGNPIAGDICFSSAGCRISLNPTDLKLDIKSCSVFSCQLNLSGGFYTHESGSPTIFSRKVNLSAISGVSTDEQVAIDVTVSWSDRFGNHTFKIDEVMHNW